MKGFAWNHEHVYRIYCELELNLRIKPRKRIIRETLEPLAVPEAANQTWSLDFLQDPLADGRSIRLLNVLTISIGTDWRRRSKSPCLRRM
ncbi:hypothetical protein IFT58_10620 [Stenotrophomonas sp. CFBP 13718]|nr:hypothetical protein [Stenotrophomonas sp. CFBP 13718]